MDARDKPGHDDLDRIRYRSSPFRSALLALPAALISLLISSAPAYADLTRLIRQRAPERLASVV